MYTVKLKPHTMLIRKDNKGKMIALGSVVIVILFIVIVSGFNGNVPFLSGPSFYTSSVFEHGHSSHTSGNLSENNQEEIFYGIMFDAGSTGSRIHIFKFKQANDGQPFHLLDEKFEQVKPGLSSYAENPQKAAESLKGMLDRAKSSIPQSMWSKTPLALKATAGLRLLPTERAAALLNKVTSLFSQYPFVVSKSSVQIMDGTDEGIFSWFTLNFLTGTILNVNKTVGALDLGGGSTQVTFIPHSQTTLHTVPVRFIKVINIFHNEYKLYTHSYLGLGLMSGRFQMFGGVENPQARQSFPTNIFTTACLPDTSTVPWSHAGTDYIIKGANQATNFQLCYASASKIAKTKVSRTKELLEREFYAFSYYYDRAADVGLIKAKDGGEVTVGHYYKKAIQVCSRFNPDQPFLCTDLCFIAALLTEGFGFNQDKKLVLKKKIKGVETTWALGATFYLMKARENEGPLAKNRGPGR